MYNKLQSILPTDNKMIFMYYFCLHYMNIFRFRLFGKISTSGMYLSIVDIILKSYIPTNLRYVCFAMHFEARGRVFRRVILIHLKIIL